jgi:hypothetical protein
LAQVVTTSVAALATWAGSTTTDALARPTTKAPALNRIHLSAVSQRFTRDTVAPRTFGLPSRSKPCQHYRDHQLPAVSSTVHFFREKLGSYSEDEPPARQLEEPSVLIGFQISTRQSETDDFAPPTRKKWGLPVLSAEPRF